MIEKSLCEAFCRNLIVNKVPVGYAVSTGFSTADGDTIGFYVVRSIADRYRLEDDGTTIPALEAVGIRLKSGSRRRVFETILDEYGFSFDEETQLLHSDDLNEGEVAEVGLRFAQMLLRIQDLELLEPRVVESAFREDALAAIREHFGARANVVEDEPFDQAFPNYVVDAVIKTERHALAAIFIATTQGRADEAVMLSMEMRLRNWRDGKVVLLLEKAKPSAFLSERALARAQNHLDAVPVFRGFEHDAMMRIETEAFGHDLAPH